MPLYTKSIQAKVEKSDGIRICIMRRPDKNAKFDIWIPRLAPSSKLLDSYHAKKMNWSMFETLFKKEILPKQKIFLKVLCELARVHKITILCWEKTPGKCHRRLISEFCRRIDPALKIVLN